MLEVQRLSSYYGPVRALWDVSIRVEPGEVVAVLGPNGAGKSTLLRTISGLVRTRHGRIKYNGQDVTGQSPDAIVRIGIAHVPEGRRIFTQMTVLENLLMGAFTRDDDDGIQEDLEFIFTLYPDLEAKKHVRGGDLSGGQQQMLAISRASMARPSMLLMDEPSLGLSPIMVEQLARADAIRQRAGTSILLVEQNAGLALELASRVYVMQTGRVVLSGSAGELSLEKIRQAYLGHGELAAAARPGSGAEKGHALQQGAQYADGTA